MTIPDSTLKFPVIYCGPSTVGVWRHAQEMRNHSGAAEELSQYHLIDAGQVHYAVESLRAKPLAPSLIDRVFGRSRSKNLHLHLRLGDGHLSFADSVRFVQRAVRRAVPSAELANELNYKLQEATSFEQMIEVLAELRGVRFRWAMRKGRNAGR